MLVMLIFVGGDVQLRRGLGLFRHYIIYRFKRKWNLRWKWKGIYSSVLRVAWDVKQKLAQSGVEQGDNGSRKFRVVIIESWTVLSNYSMGKLVSRCLLRQDR